MDETIPYDKYQLQVLLGEVQGYLAELRYIDTAMSYLEREAMSLTSIKDHLLASLPERIHPFSVEFGKTYPFTKWYSAGDWVDTPLSLIPNGAFPLSSVDDTKVDRIKARLAELSTEADEWAAAEIGAIKERIEPLTWPEGNLYLRECIAPLQDMQVMLEDRISHDFGRLHHTLSSWRGEAAENFDTTFYSRFEHTLRSQKQLLTALMGGVVAAKAIAESAQHSVMNVAHAAKLALLDQLRLAQATAELERQQSAQRAIIVAGGLATVFGGILAVGPALAAGSAAGLWGATFATVAGGAQLATLGIPSEGAEEYTVGGATAEALLGSLFSAIDQIFLNEVDQHDNLLRELNRVLERVEMLRNRDEGDDGRLIPARPSLVDGVDSETFYVP